MKRYLVFGGETYYPSGGWQDLIGSFAERGEAITFARTCVHAYDWIHVVDLETEAEIANSQWEKELVE